VSPAEAIAILKSQPTVVLDEGACRNVEDSETMAVVILDVGQRDAIVATLNEAEAKLKAIKDLAVKAIELIKF